MHTGILCFMKRKKQIEENSIGGGRKRRPVPLFGDTKNAHDYAPPVRAEESGIGKQGSCVIQFESKNLSDPHGR